MVKKTELSDLSMIDLSALMSHYSRRMSKLTERTPENTALWEQMAFKRGCLGTEFQRRIDLINFPTITKKDTDERG